MDRLGAMRLFVAAVEHGSLAASARQGGVSAASATRAIDGLERHVGTRLLQRSTRSLRLTPFGETYVATCREVLAALDGVERGAAAEREAPSGLLTVTAPVMFGELHVAPMLDLFLDAHPAVQGRLLLFDRVVDLVAEGIDVAVRLAVLPDGPLVATRLGAVRRILCASPDYLARRGRPDTVAALARHDLILAEAPGGRATLRIGHETVTVRPRLVVNSVSSLIGSAVAGRGIVPAMSYQVASLVRSGDLAVLFPEARSAPVPVSLVSPPGRPQPARLRAFLDFARPRLRKRLGEIGAVLS